MCGVKLKSVQCIKDWGVIIASNHKFSQQCNDAANKENRMLDFIHRNFLLKNKEVILLLYNSFGLPTMQRTLLNQKVLSVGLQK